MAEENKITDDELLLRCQNGDVDAFAHLVGRYRSVLFSYLLRLTGNFELSQDIFQETLIKVWENISRCKRNGKFKHWMFRIAYNAAMDMFRKSKNNVDLQSIKDFASANDPLVSMVNDEKRNMLHTAMQQLTEKQKQVFLLRQHGDMTFKEIAEIMKEPLNTVLSHMNYAVKKLQKLLRDHNEN